VIRITLQAHVILTKMEQKFEHNMGFEPWSFAGWMHKHTRKFDGRS